ncbi:MAG: VOC family protein [Ignavibacteriales bacterium]|nr:VOC family protein [Ignavibacteriales bacterium]
MNKAIKLRIARPTDNLETLSKMYEKGLGLEVLAKFENHENFDGIILGHPNIDYHIEFTHHKGTKVGKAPTMDNLLVFYFEDKIEWQAKCVQMSSAGFLVVKSYNPYWDRNGKTFEDIDGYRVVLQNQIWKK